MNGRFGSAPESTRSIRRRSLAARVLASFSLVVLAFVATIVAGLAAQRLGSRDVATMSQGYLPIEIKLAQVRATQWNVAARLDRLLDDPRAVGITREWVLTSARGLPAALAEARALASQRLAGSDDGDAIAAQVVGPMDKIERELSDAAKGLPELFGAVEEAARSGDRTDAERKLREVAARERLVAEGLDALAHSIERRRAAVVDRTVTRDRRAIVASALLAILSLIVAGVASSLVRRRLAPLARLTERAQAIAAGDRSPIPQDLTDGQRGLLGGASRDEITDLAVAFGAMVDGVATRDADLLRLRRRQEDIVNNQRAAVVALRRDGTVEAANPAARAILDAQLGRSLGETAPVLWGVIADDVARAVTTGAPDPAPRLGLTLLRRPAAESNATEALASASLVVDVRVAPMHAEGLSEVGERLALLVVDDVSDAAAARGRALQAERLAAIGKMAAHVTHEIRNPLSSIGLNVELLEETLATAHVEGEGRRLLAAIAREVQRLSDISEDYLRVARAPSPRPARVDVGELVRDVLSFSRPELERARVATRLHMDAPDAPDAPDAFGARRTVARLDEGQIRQALLNLVRNAREAMEDGGVLDVSVTSEGAFAVIRIEDDGPGIPDDARARVFDPFFTTKSTGTGLGLPLTRQIVEAHGGTIACFARAPHGTCFELRVPRAVGDE